MGILVILGVAIAVGAGLAVAASIAKRRSSAELGLVIDIASKPWIRSMPLDIYRGWSEVEIEWVMVGTRNGRRVWLFELELERPGDIEREYTGVVYEVPGLRRTHDVVKPLGVEHVECIDGHLIVFVGELPWKRLGDALDAADGVLAQLTREGVA